MILIGQMVLMSSPSSSIIFIVMCMFCYGFHSNNLYMLKKHVIIDMMQISLISISCNVCDDNFVDDPQHYM